MKKNLFLLLILSSFFSNSQNEIKRELGDFYKIQTYDLLKVNLIKSDKNHVIISGQHPNYVVVKNKNGELKIRMGIEKRLSGSETKVVGASSYNMALSKKRAEEIKKILLFNLIDEKLITNVDGKGELLYKTVATSSPERIRALNRKVELSVSLSQEAKLENEPKLVKGSSLVIEDLLFLTGYSYLTPSSKKSLDLVFEKIKDLPFSFVIQGHVCCTSGQKDAIDRATKKRNLSVVRAKFVYDYFLEKGIDSKRMTFEGLGHQFPLGGKPEQDRRVEILIESDF